MLVCIIIKFQTIGPAGLVQVEKHFLLGIVLTIVDGDGVVVLVESAHLGDHAGWLQVSNVRSRLTRFGAHHHSLTIDAAESIDDNLALD